MPETAAPARTQKKLSKVRTYSLIIVVPTRRLKPISGQTKVGLLRSVPTGPSGVEGWRHILSNRKRYCLVGTGSRAQLYLDAMADKYRDTAALAGICDINPGRLAQSQGAIVGRLGTAVPGYVAADFEKMIGECRPDVVIVTTGPDRTHSEYICRSMELGCDVVTEKPMTTDETQALKILDTVQRTGRKLQVTFNYRYAPPCAQVRELIRQDSIGKVLSVDFAWTLDTRHGADYFRRWHRQLANSGSLLVHKATHHFDLVNWWIDDIPEEVFAFGTLNYYTPERAAELGLEGRSERCTTCPVASKCPFHLDTGAEWFRKLYGDNERHDGYFRDRCVFSPEIDIWDTMSANVRYRGGAVMSYLLHTYSPIEGYRVAFNGTKGRIEHYANENTYVSGDENVPGELARDSVGVTLIPEFRSPSALTPRLSEGGHGGGDPAMLADIFEPDGGTDPLGRKADQVDGIYSIMVGIAAYRSIQQERPVKIPELLGNRPV